MRLNLGITLAGHRATWRFRDSNLLDDWLSGQPWMRDGGIRVVRIRDRDIEEDVLGGLSRSIWTADQLGDVQVKIFSDNHLVKGLRSAICRRLELATTSTAMSLHSAGFALRKPIVFVTRIIPNAGIRYGMTRYQYVRNLLAVSMEYILRYYCLTRMMTRWVARRMISALAAQLTESQERELPRD